MNVRRTLEACRAEDRAALIGYLPVGYPDVPTSIAAMTAMVDAGVDIVEVGLPYSDPLMDGPVVQRAAEEPSPSAPASTTSSRPAARSPTPARRPSS